MPTRSAFMLQKSTENRNLYDSYKVFTRNQAKIYKNISDILKIKYYISINFLKILNMNQKHK